MSVNFVINSLKWVFYTYTRKERGPLLNLSLRKHVTSTLPRSSILCTLAVLSTMSVNFVINSLKWVFYTYTRKERGRLLNLSLRKYVTSHCLALASFVTLAVLSTTL